MTSVADRNLSKYMHDKILGMLEQLTEEDAKSIYASLRKKLALPESPIDFLKKTAPGSVYTMATTEETYKQNTDRMWTSAKIDMSWKDMNPSEKASFIEHHARTLKRQLIELMMDTNIINCKFVSADDIGSGQTVLKCIAEYRR